MQAKKLEIWNFKKHYLNPGIILAASCEFLKHWPTQYFIVSILVFTKIILHNFKMIIYYIKSRNSSPILANISTHLNKGNLL